MGQTASHSKVAAATAESFRGHLLLQGPGAAGSFRLPLGKLSRMFHWLTNNLLRQNTQWDPLRPRAANRGTTIRDVDGVVNQIDADVIQHQSV